MSNLVSNSGVKLVNYTRYNTNDLLVMVNAVESALKKLGCEFEDQKSDRSITFKDYNPTHPWRNITTYNANTRNHVRQRVRNYTSAAATWKWAGGTLGIVPPGRIYIDPIQALTSMTESEQRIPFEMFRQLWRDVVHFYPEARNLRDVDGKELRYDIAGTPDTNLSVRVGKRRAEKRTNADSREMAAAHRRKRLYSSSYYLGRAIDATERVCRNLTVAERHAARCGGVDIVDQAELKDALEVLRKYRIEVQHQYNR